MSQALPLHLALHLVPYITPADIARAQSVCKSWQDVFSSQKLLQTALRVHFPYSHEVRSRFSLQPPSAASAFNLISRRYAALKSGTPQQELRFPISKTRRDIYVWAFAENLLVYQSSHYPAVLSLIYLDYSASPRRIRTGTIVLDSWAKQVIRVKVCRDVLVVERTDERATTLGRTNFFATTECYRLQLSGTDGVSAKQMSVINTSEFAYIDYSHQILSDNSGMYYAAYSRSSSGFDGGIGVWDVENGAEVKRIPPAMLEGMGLMTDLVLVQTGGQHQVVIVGNDKRNNNPRRWGRYPGKWGYLSNFRTFTVEGDENEQQAKGFVGRTKAECPRGSNLLTTSFKVPRLPGGLEQAEDLEGGEEEEAALMLWELGDFSGQPTASYHTLSGNHSILGVGPDETIHADIKYCLPSASEARDSGQPPAPFSVKTRDALSFTMDFTGRNEDFEDTRLMLYHLRVQGFYPSPTSPGVMELEWETCLKDLGSDARNRKKDRGIYSANRNVTYLNVYGMEVIGDERAIAFLELKEGGMDLVVVVWDAPFDIPAGAEMNTGRYMRHRKLGGRKEERILERSVVEQV